MNTIRLKMPRGGDGPDQYAGERGEHRTYEVIAPLPRSTLNQIQSCIALFLLDDKLPVISPLIRPGTEGDLRMEGGNVHIVLWQQVTGCRALRIQLVCYGDADGQTFVDNSPVSERILFRRSLPGRLEDLPEISDSPGILAQLIAWMHTHPNKPVLDALSEEDGALCFDGAALATAAALEAEAAARAGEDENIWDDVTPMTNLELDALINQALAAI